MSQGPKAEKNDLERLAQRLAQQADTTLKVSHLLRACVLLLQHGEEQLLQEARRGARLVRPSNGNPVAMAGFEHRVAQLLLTALKISPPL